MRNSCWITKATDTHSEYVMFVAFPRQQCYTNAPHLCVHCLLLLFDKWIGLHTQGVVETGSDTNEFP